MYLIFNYMWNTQTRAKRNILIPYAIFAVPLIRAAIGYSYREYLAWGACLMLTIGINGVFQEPKEPSIVTYPGKSPLFISVLLCTFITSHAQTLDDEGLQRFPEKNGMIRVIRDNDRYQFYDLQHRLVLDLKGFSYAGDFYEGMAIVKGQGEISYGAINRQGELVVDTVWFGIQPSSYGFMMVAEHDGYVTEDRGNGRRKYPREKWKLVESHTGNVLDEIQFRALTNIGGYASGIDIQGNKCLIDVRKINPGLYDPFMKALMEINSQPVTYRLNHEEGTIQFIFEHSGRTALMYEYNKDPFRKYEFEWYRAQDHPPTEKSG